MLHIAPIGIEAIGNGNINALYDAAQNGRISLYKQNGIEKERIARVAWRNAQAMQKSQKFCLVHGGFRDQCMEGQLSSR